MTAKLTRRQTQQHVTAIWQRYCEQGYITRNQVIEIAATGLAYTRFVRLVESYGLRLPDVWDQHKANAYGYLTALQEAGYSTDNLPTMSEAGQVWGVSSSLAHSRFSQIAKFFPCGVTWRRVNKPVDEWIEREPIAKPKPETFRVGYGYGEGLVCVPNGLLRDDRTGMVRYRYLVI